MNIQFTNEQKEILKKARDTYGNMNQILVSNEELCELASVCAKFPRYSSTEKAISALYSRAVDEVADVFIVLDHITEIFQLSDSDVKARVQAKLERLDRWLNMSDSMEQTTIDRVVVEQRKRPEKCKDCTHRKGFPVYPCDECGTHNNFTHYQKTYNCSKCKHSGDVRNIYPGGICADCCVNEGKNFEPLEI